MALFALGFPGGLSRREGCRGGREEGGGGGRMVEQASQEEELGGLMRVQILQVQVSVLEEEGGGGEGGGEEEVVRSMRGVVEGVEDSGDCRGGGRPSGI